jgi:hypothetical protein
MGQEIECRMRYQSREAAGKAYLETEYLLFRGSERLKIPLKDLTSVRASGSVLSLTFSGGEAFFELGPAAEKWARKILHPPSRLDKLGVKPGLAVAVAGEFDKDFLAELPPPASKGKCDLLFFAADRAAGLIKVRKLASRLKPEGALWIVFPKGVKPIRELDVLAAGRAAGLKDVKVASFSAAHTALKFVIPLAARSARA